jgi:hypothetical protein
MRQRARIGAMALAATLAMAGAAHAQMPPPSYQVTGQDAASIELRFHNMQLRAVHADDSQNALSLDFQQPVDGAVFDRLARDLPGWVGLAYANFDNGVIRATRPVTFLTRNEPDGFSLRMVARGPVGPVAQNAPPPGVFAPPPPMRGGIDTAPPPPGPPIDDIFRRHDSYGALRNYAALELALAPADPVWNKVYGRAAMLSDSEYSLGSDYRSFDNGDRLIASQMHFKLGIGNGLSFIGRLNDVDVDSPRTRAPNGSFVAARTNLVTGEGGLALETGGDTEVTLEALEGNNITGGRLGLYTGGPDSFWNVVLDYNKPNLDTPAAIWSRGDKDEAVVAMGQRLGYGLWASLAGHATQYGVHGDAGAVLTAGWDGNLRWSTDLGGIMAGISYDGHGEYIVRNDSFTGAAPTPYVPLGIRDRETHAVTASLSSLLWGDTLWFDLFGGYIDDRYAGDGGIEGISIHYTPQPGVDLALGMRHTDVSLVQGEEGGEISGGLNLTLGFNAPARPTWMW